MRCNYGALGLISREGIGKVRSFQPTYFQEISHKTITMGARVFGKNN